MYKLYFAFKFCVETCMNLRKIFKANKIAFGRKQPKSVECRKSQIEVLDPLTIDFAKKERSFAIKPRFASDTRR